MNTDYFIAGSEAVDIARFPLSPNWSTLTAGPLAVVGHGQDSSLSMSVSNIPEMDFGVACDFSFTVNMQVLGYHLLFFDFEYVADSPIIKGWFDVSIHEDEWIIPMSEPILWLMNKIVDLDNNRRVSFLVNVLIKRLDPTVHVKVKSEIKIQRGTVGSLMSVTGMMMLAYSAVRLINQPVSLYPRVPRDIPDPTLMPLGARLIPRRKVAPLARRVL